MKKELWFALAVLIVLALACNLPGAGDSDQPPTMTAQPGIVRQDQPLPPGGSGLATSPPEQAAPPTAQVIIVTATPEPTQIPSQPVTIRKGLASLNSYQMVLAIESAGPAPQDFSEMVMDISYDSNADALYMSQVMRTSSVDSPEIDEDRSETYSVGLVQCDISDGDYDVEQLTPAQKEMMDLMLEMIDMTPIITNPEYVRAEPFNGVPSNYFTFQISGMGSQSGAEIVSNQGEYWLAVDGNYIMKYNLRLETRDEDGSLMRFVVRIEMLSVNQPVTIVMPEGCVGGE